MNDTLDANRLDLIRSYCYAELGALDRRAEEIAIVGGGYSPTIGAQRDLLRKILDMTYGVL